MHLRYALNRVTDAGFPAVAIIISAIFGAYTFLDILFVQRAPRLAFDFNYWQKEQFSRLWRVFGPRTGKNVRSTVDALASVASNVVLDIGPGSGENIEFYKRKYISKLYLLEPCYGLHESLQMNLKKAGFEQVSTIIACGIQDHDVLHAHGITPASVDTVVTFKALCSVPAPRETCQFLYDLLKPSGQWVLVEHVLADEKYPLSRHLQDMYQLLWPTLVGGNVNRDIAKYVKEAGKWTRVELARAEGEVGWEVLGHIIGRLVK